MVWCGVVWCGVVWYGVVWFGRWQQCSVILCGVVRYHNIESGMASYDILWCSISY